MKHAEMMREVRRQLVHAAGIVTILSLVWLGREMTAALILIGLCVLFAWATFRRKMRMRDPVEHFVHGHERPGEWQFMGAFTYYIGVLITILLFQQTAAIVAIAILAIGDATAPLIGKLYGKHKLPINRRKSWEGSLAFFLPTLVILCLAVSPVRALVYASLLTFVEALPVFDDNTTLPIAAGVLLSLPF